MAPTPELVMAALATVNDPEIRRPITELDMVKSVDISPEGAVRVAEYWQLVLGPLFLLVVLFARGGIDGMFERKRRD